MKNKKILILFLCFILALPLLLGNNNKAFASDTVYLGGFPAGFSVKEKGAKVVGVSEVLTENGFVSPAKEVDVRAGDVIISIDGNNVFDAFSIEKALKNGDIKVLIIERKGETIIKNVYPALSVDGKYRLGVNVRESITGIGTITFIKGKNYASLGHPILDEDGKIVDISGGNLYEATILGYIRGERYRAGELKGNIFGESIIGDIKLNVLSGVYGELNEKNVLSNLKEIELGEGKVGKAEIYTTIKGETPKSYQISIIKNDLSQEVKNFVIRVEDEELLNKTGGILQGMSGSPIVQEGRLVGAVTHVFINDSKLGYGIAIEKMCSNI